MPSAAAQRLLVDGWTRRGLPARALLPVALLYGGLIGVRKALYRHRILRAARVPVPVVVVGNVVAGGGGKTPLVLAIVRHLQAGGWRVGVVSRGYGRHGADCHEVTDDSRPQDAGDEPLLIRQRTGAPVFVAARRIDVARVLLERFPDTDVLLCDDGLQHLQLHRDIEICVFDARGVGNGWLLPAGPLREPWPRPVDLVVAEGRPAPDPAAWPVGRTLAGQARQADGSLRSLQELGAAPVWAVAGIANPGSFFAMLRGAGMTLAGTTALPDHAAFEDTAWLPPGVHTLVCTEKDAVKLWALRPDAWAVPLALELPRGFWARLDALLTAQRAATLSSPHGHTSA